MKEVTQLKNNFRKLQKSVQSGLSEIKKNLRLLCEKLGHKYFTKVSYPGTSEKISSANDSSNSDDGTFVSPKAQENTLGKGKRPWTRSSAKKTFIVL